jgi:hypothetical protein
MDAIRPSPDLTSVLVRGREDENGFTGNWGVVARAVCADRGVAGLERVVASNAFDSDEIQRVTATCPAGKNLLGTGGLIQGGLGQVVIDDLRPNATLTSVTVTGIEDENGFAGDWTPVAYAICADP